MQNSKDIIKATRTHHEFNKVAGYKLHRNLLHLYGLVEREIKDTNLFRIPSRIKYLGINASKEVKSIFRKLQDIDNKK